VIRHPTRTLPNGFWSMNIAIAESKGCENISNYCPKTPFLKFLSAILDHFELSGKIGLLYLFHVLVFQPSGFVNSFSGFVVNDTSSWSEFRRPRED